MMKLATNFFKDLLTTILFFLYDIGDVSIRVQSSDLYPPSNKVLLFSRDSM